jgi:hypothetical protein
VNGEDSDLQSLRAESSSSITRKDPQFLVLNRCHSHGTAVRWLQPHSRTTRAPVTHTRPTIRDCSTVKRRCCVVQISIYHREAQNLVGNPHFQRVHLPCCADDPNTGVFINQPSRQKPRPPIKRCIQISIPSSAFFATKPRAEAGLRTVNCCRYPEVRNKKFLRRNFRFLIFTTDADHAVKENAALPALADRH